MKQHRRGSEKLLASCSDMQTLTDEELAQVNGGYSLTGVWKVFPRGLPWPELFQATDLYKVNEIGQLDGSVLRF